MGTKRRDPWDDQQPDDRPRRLLQAIDKLVGAVREAIRANQHVQITETLESLGINYVQGDKSWKIAVQEIQGDGMRRKVTAANKQLRTTTRRLIEGSEQLASLKRQYNALTDRLGNIFTTESQEAVERAQKIFGKDFPDLELEARIARFRAAVAILRTTLDRATAPPEPVEEPEAAAMTSPIVEKSKAPVTAPLAVVEKEDAEPTLCPICKLRQPEVEFTVYSDTLISTIFGLGKGTHPMCQTCKDLLIEGIVANRVCREDPTAPVGMRLKHFLHEKVGVSQCALPNCDWLVPVDGKPFHLYEPRNQKDRMAIIFDEMVETAFGGREIKPCPRCFGRLLNSVLGRNGDNPPLPYSRRIQRLGAMGFELAIPEKHRCQAEWNHECSGPALYTWEAHDRAAEPYNGLGICGQARDDLIALHEAWVRADRLGLLVKFGTWTIRKRNKTGPRAAAEYLREKVDEYLVPCPNPLGIRSCEGRRDPKYPTCRSCTEAGWNGNPFAYRHGDLYTRMCPKCEMEYTVPGWTLAQMRKNRRDDRNVLCPDCKQKLESAQIPEEVGEGPSGMGVESLVGKKKSKKPTAVQEASAVA